MIDIGVAKTNEIKALRWKTILNLNSILQGYLFKIGPFMQHTLFNLNGINWIGKRVKQINVAKYNYGKNV